MDLVKKAQAIAINPIPSRHATGFGTWKASSLFEKLGFTLCESPLSTLKPGDGRASDDDLSNFDRLIFLGEG